MNLIEGRIYRGKINNLPVIYIGISNKNSDHILIQHRFDYLKPIKSLVGYIQTDEEVKKENYQEDKTMTVLYGRKVV